MSIAQSDCDDLLYVSEGDKPGIHITYSDEVELTPICIGRTPTITLLRSSEYDALIVCIKFCTSNPGSQVVFNFDDGSSVTVDADWYGRTAQMWFGTEFDFKDLLIESILINESELFLSESDAEYLRCCFACLLW